MGNNWVRIEDLSRFTKQFTPKEIHPDDPRHTPHWRTLKKNCIEGVWFENYGKMQFGPGRLGFYGKFCTIEHTDKIQKTRFYTNPDIRDLEWERSYMYLQAEGFSGWTEDNKYTSFRDIKELPHPSKMTWEERAEYSSIITPDGKFKEYIPAKENIRMLHDRTKGTPHYLNPTMNIMELGSRGGGKSYYYSLAGAKYRICFDGVKYYTTDFRLNPPTVNILVGSGRTDKSSDFVNKIKTSMNALAKKSALGAWGSLGQEDYEPSPFFKDMKGSLKPNNKDNAWRHEYEMNINGRWVDGFGTLSKVFHASYSPQKREGAEAGAGGRYTDVFYEEVGLTEKVIEAFNSNKAAVTTGVVQFGVQVFLGTAGNIETIIPARKIMLHPEDYNVIPYYDHYDGTGGNTGFFLPAYMTAGAFKDKNGNTDIPRAKAYYEKRRAKASESRDPSILRVEKMNYPIYISDMWQTNKGTILPAKEAEEREKKLMKNSFYQKLSKAIKLHWSSEKSTGVDYDIVHQPEPFYEFPLESGQQRKSWAGEILVYDMPIQTKGVVLNDMYMFTHDPYVSDNWDEGGSLGVVHVWLTPKYWNTHMITSPLVATYIGKPQGGKKEFYKNLEMLMAFYGGPIRGLWYEANRGEFCRGFFVRKKKTKLLCLRPQFEKGDKTQQKAVTQYGFVVGNHHSKIPMVDDLADFLLQTVTVQGEEKLVIETIPCIFTIRQIKLYNIDGNFDAVSSLLGFPLYMREEEHRIMAKDKTKRVKKNPLALLSTNKNLTKRA